MMTEPAASRTRKRLLGPTGAGLAALVLGVLGAWLIAARQTQLNDETIAIRFTARADRAADKIRSRLAGYENGLRGARGTVLAGGFDKLTLAQYQLYASSRDTEREFPGARGIGIIKRVPHAAREVYLDAMRRDGRPDFSIRQLTPHESENYVIQLIEPVERNRAAVGLDIASETMRRAAAVSAMDVGRATLTAPITLVQATGKPLRSFLLLLPIYTLPRIPADLEARRAATWGWSYAPLVMDEVLAGLELGAELWLALRDLDSQRSEVFFSTGPAPSNDVLSARHVAFTIYGRHWEAELRATPAFIAGLNLPDPRTIGLIGTVLATLLAGLAFAYAQSTNRAAQVRAEQARRAAIVASSNDAIIGETLDGVVTDWNEGAVRLFGYSAEQALGKSAQALILPLDRLDEDAKIREQIARGDDVRAFDTMRRTRDGTAIDVSVSASPIIGAAGERLGFAKTIRDIRAAKSAERRGRELNIELERQVAERTLLLEAARRDLRNILDAVPPLIAYWDRDLRNRFVNQAYGDWLGADLASLAGTHARDVLGATFEESLPRLKDALCGERQVFEAVLNAPSTGQKHDFLAHYIPDLVDGESRGVYAIMFDITEQNRDRVRLVETSSLLHAVLESASEISMIATDPNFVITVWNSGAERMLGYASEDVVGRATPALIHDENEVRARGAELSALTGTLVEGGQVFIHPLALRQPREWTYICKDGTRIPVSLTVTAMHNDAGELFGYLGVAQDVTSRKEFEASLREAMQKAEQASQAKSQFLANMSHEIRTPMNAVIGLTYLLSLTPLDSEQAANLSKIRLASKSLLALINDILDLSKIEARELVLEQVTFDLPRLLAEVCEVMRVTADEKGIAFHVAVPTDLPAAMRGDPTRLQQILVNLLSNAIKFTERGSVSLRVQHRQHDEPRVDLHFEVEDTGIGISSEQQTRLFAPFAQADASTTRRFGGTGLGLSIVQRLASLMHGDVEVRSREGLGSTFYVRISLERAHDADMPKTTGKAVARSGGLAHIRVLVVDDNELNLEVAQRILQLQKAEVTLASNGRQALERLRMEPNKYDVVLMDVQMPELDGREASRIIREDLGLQVPIIALTAEAQEHERQRALRAGMNDYITKPFEPTALVECVRRHIHRQAVEHVEQPESEQVEELPWPELDGIDAAEARKRFAGDVDLFRKLLLQFVEEFSEPVLGADSTAEQLAHAAKQLHSLRGAAGQLGAGQLCVLASDAEVACRRRDAQSAAQLAREIGEQLERLRAAATGLTAELAPGPARPARGRHAS